MTRLKIGKGGDNMNEQMQNQPMQQDNAQGMMQTQPESASTPVGEAQVPPMETTAQAPATPSADAVYASFGQRFVAVILDGIILSFAQNILFMLFGLSDNSMIMFVISLALTGLYAGYFLSTTGQTIGKKVMKIKVVKKGSNELLSVQDALLRDVVGKFVSSIILMIGYLMMLWDKDKQTLHDKFVNSVVIKMN